MLRGAGGGKVAFSPASLSGLVLWLDASAITGLVDSDPVGTWSDLSGNGNDATQATESKKPTYKTNIQNGKQVVRFDGVDDFLKTVTFSALAQPLTILLACKYTDNDAGQYIFSGNTDVECVFKANDPTVDKIGMRWPTDQAVGDTLSGTVLRQYTAVFNGGSSYYRYNGGNQSANVAIGAGTAAAFTIGAAQAGAVSLNGDIAEVIVYSSTLSGSDLSLVESYLNSKWAIY